MTDRCYYRLETDSRLIEEARNNPNRELAIALGERLSDVLASAEEDYEDLRNEAEDAKIDARKLEFQIEELERKVDTLELMLGTREDQIEELQNELAKLKEEQNA